MLRSMIIAACAAVFCAKTTSAANVDFEDLTLGTMYAVGSSFTTGGVMVTNQTFTWSSGTPATSGFSQVENGGLAGGSGQEMEVNNVLLDFAIAPTTSLTMNFGEYGGNLNILVNGDFRNFGDFADINMMTIGGVDVAVTNGNGNDRGVLTLTGAITNFAIGGQELWIDDLTTAPAVPVPASALLLAGGIAALSRLRKRSA